MHVPDGFLTNRVALLLDAVSGTTIFFATRRVTIESSGRLIPIMGVMAAFVLAAQMLNFPVLGGTSGHLVGGALLAILLGPMAGFLTMTTVILAQAIFLQDGGILALGANIFNIGAVTSFCGYGLYRLLGGTDPAPKRMSVAAFVAGWGSLMVSAVCCAVQLAVSGAIGLRTGLAAMAGYHAIIGIAEGALTASILAFLVRVRPDLIRRAGELRLRAADWAGAVVLVALPPTILLLAGASRLPDPLQALLEGAAPAGTAAHGDPLTSTLRYRDYMEQAAVFLLLIGIAYLAARLSHRKRGAS